LCAAKKSNDLATFVEARLGKPSHLLEGDKLKQFLAQVCHALLISTAAAQHLQSLGPAAARVVLRCISDSLAKIKMCFVAAEWQGAALLCCVG
jgi:hypothetical protein